MFGLRILRLGNVCQVVLGYFPQSAMSGTVSFENTRYMVYDMFCFLPFALRCGVTVSFTIVNAMGPSIPPHHHSTLLEAPV